jgi:hypothetical protein
MSIAATAVGRGGIVFASPGDHHRHDLDLAEVVCRPPRAT